MWNMLVENSGLLLALLAAGAGAGVAAGMFGVGGGVIIVPALYFTLSSLGFSETAMHVSVGTSLATIIATSIRSVISHHAKEAVDWKILSTWSPFIMLGALLGSFLASEISGRNLTIFFGVTAFLLAAQLIFGRPNWKLSNDVPQGPVSWAISVVIGGASSLMGIGGGVFGVTTLVLFGRPIHQAIGTSAGFGAAIGIPGALGYAISGWRIDNLPPFSFGYISLPGFILIALMTTTLAPVGARIAHGMNGVLLRRIFGVLLILTALNMLRKVLFV